MRLSDEELMVMFAAGTKEALTMLYERYGNRVYRFALSCLGSVPDAEDVVQDVFINVARAADSYHPTDRFKSWLFKISANRIRDVGRRRGVWHRIPGNGMVQDEWDGRSDHGRFERRLIAADLLCNIMDRLQPEDRLLIMLKELEGLDSAAIARILNVSPGAIRVRLHRIRAGLKPLCEAKNRGKEENGGIGP